MIKRNVKFEIANGTVLPSVPQYGGVKGEHNATLLGITLASGMYEEGDAARLSFTMGDGTVLSSDILTVTGDGAYIEYAIPQLLTVAAGQLCVRVVISSINENGEEIQIYRSPEMVLYFEDASVENGTPFWTGVSEMLTRTVTAKEEAVAAQESAAVHADTALQARQDAAAAKNAAVAAQNTAEMWRDLAGRSSDAASESAQTAKQYAASAQADAERAKEDAEAQRTAAEEARLGAESAASSAWEAVNTPGRQGASAYELAVANGFEGDEAAWLASLEGMSAYELALYNNLTGMEEREWLESLKGQDGFSPTVSVSKLAYGSVIYITDKDGTKTASVSDGANGVDGKSAYELAVANGFEGDEAAWLASLKGDKGDTGAHGEKGEKGEKGERGPQGEAGADGATAAEVIAAMTTETWTFELEDGTTVEKAVPIV